MTITTAKRPAIAALRLTPLALAAMLLSNECRADDWRIAPTVTLRETYSDNLNNQNDTLARSGFVTDAGPAVSVRKDGRRLKLSASAEYRRFVYQHDDIPNVHDSETRYQAAMKSELIDDFLFLDGGASRSRQAASAFGPVTANSFSSLNNIDVRTWSLSPSLRHRFGSTAVVAAQFTRDSVRSDRGNAFGNTTGSSTAINAMSGPSFRELGWNLAYNRQELSSTIGGDSRSQTGNAGLQWRLDPHLNLTANAGYDKFEYPAFNQRTKGPSWSLGFMWAPSARTSVNATFGHRYFGKTGSLLASHRTRHSSWSLSYSDAITTTRAQFLLPATVDTASLIDSMLRTAYPDPTEREQMVAAYMAATGLPPSLPNTINYLSNRYARNKHLQAGALFRGARTDLAVSVFKDQRNAVSLQQSDSTLLPSQLSTLNDNTRQRGASANASYKLSSSTRAQASLYAARIESIDTGLINNLRQLSLGLNRRFDAKTIGTLDVRHSTGRAGLFTSDKYHENALVATLSVRY
jgi:uncharacterized protein (PEP-CTERM system associated)